MKKKLRIWALILQFINATCGFMPVFFKIYVKKTDNIALGFYYDLGSYSCSMVGINDTIHSAFSWVIVLLWLLCIIVLFISILKDSKNTVVTWLPSLNLIFFLFFAIPAANFYEFVSVYHYSVDVYWMFYISLALQVASAVLVAIPAKEKAVPEIAASAPEAAPQSNQVVEELTELKKLMDDGVITEEEFHAKKKQLLNL